MARYIWSVVVVSFSVDWLLLLGASKLSGGQGRWPQLLLGALLAALYTGACLYTERMASPWGRLLCLLVVSAVAFGVKRDSLLPAAVYLAMNGAAVLLAKGIGDGHGAVAAALVAALCLLRRSPMGRTVPVKLRYGTQELHIRALLDTGNCLHDPLTGDRVLVLGAEAAKKLVGLELRELEDPIGTVAKGKVQGLRLIPIQTVGGKGLLLALRIPEVRLGNNSKSRVVAFAPCLMDERNGFHGLTGGIA